MNEKLQFEHLVALVNRMQTIVDTMAKQLINQTRLLSNLLEKCRYCGKNPVTLTHMHLPHIRACDSCGSRLIAMSNSNKEFDVNPDDIEGIELQKNTYSDWVDVELVDEIRETHSLAGHLHDVLAENSNKKFGSS